MKLLAVLLHVNDVPDVGCVPGGAGQAQVDGEHGGLPKGLADLPEKTLKQSR